MRKACRRLPPARLCISTCRRRGPHPHPSLPDCWRQKAQRWAPPQQFATEQNLVRKRTFLRVSAGIPKTYELIMIKSTLIEFMVSPSFVQQAASWMQAKHTIFSITGPRWQHCLPEAVLSAVHVSWELGPSNPKMRLKTPCPCGIPV